MIVRPGSVQRKTEKFVLMYRNIFLVVLGQEVDEYSASARLHEFGIAASGIKKNPIFGNGKLSNQWRGGYEGILGYFYPSDIGLIGAIYLYGVFGFIIFNLQYLLAYYYLKKIKHLKKDTFLMACKYFLFYFFINSLASASTFYFTSISITMIVVIYYYMQLDNDCSEGITKRLEGCI